MASKQENFEHQILTLKAQRLSLIENEMFPLMDANTIVFFLLLRIKTAQFPIKIVWISLLFDLS